RRREQRRGARGDRSALPAPDGSGPPPRRPEQGEGEAGVDSLDELPRAGRPDGRRGRAARRARGAAAGGGAMNPDGRVFVAGHRGLVGSAVVRALQRDGYANIVTRDRAQLDLLDQRGVHDFFRTERPEYVFLAAARVGGIAANAARQADFLYENLMIAANVIHA